MRCWINRPTSPSNSRSTSLTSTQLHSTVSAVLLAQHGWGDAMSEHETYPTTSTSQSQLSERRAYVRLACDLDATCRMADGFREVGWHGKVHNISRGGIGLLTSHRFRPGTELAIDLRDRSDTVVRTVRVRVVHATATFVDGNSSWLQGCEFDAPLSEEEF